MALCPPFRADQVGSLRPEALKRAREQLLGLQTPTSSLGNPLTQADQETKLARIVETAAKVWGSR